MNLNSKKKSTRVCVGLFFLLGGTEYAVILPTLWLYLQHKFDAEPWFFGVVFSAFCFSNLISSPLFGFWVDYTQKTKTAILFANLFEIGGNFLYCIAWSKYWVLGARLVAGIGAGIGGGIFAQIARTTTEKERTGMYSIAMALRQFGLLVGPGLNLFLREFNVKLGPFLIDKYTAPGIFMAVVWLIVELIMVFFYFDLPKVMSKNDDDLCVSTDNSVNNINGSYRKRRRTNSVVDDWHLAKDLVKEEVIVILASQFMIFFNETALESIFTPLSEYLLGWKEIENSIAFCLIAFEAISVFILVRKISLKLADRWLIVIGIAFEGFALVWYLALLANAKPYESIVLPTLIVGTLVIVFGLPFFAVANVSLYSKLTDEKTQGIAQGIQRSVTGVAMILGPLWGGALTKRLYLMLGVMAGLEVILAILMFLSFHRLKVPEKQTPPPQYGEINADNERQPLLA
ncbi:major facilitator superfamily domain-containing protein 8-like [Porites lutea]|uniref:major facilitator superfamily domain-containing protein 8-like n=1 Tax=Porites lutea TaxID=51062 RepID=UPI003CC5C32C